MHVTLEYVVAAGMIFVMLAVTMTTTTSLNYVYTTQKKEFQLVEVAERTLDTILLCSGDPRGWGTDYSINWTHTSGLAAFGLSTSNQTIYRLDADKVTRLCNGSASDPYDNYYYLAPKIAADLLKLTRDYGFRLSILPIFKIAATAPPGDTVLRLNVSSQDGDEIPSANVTAMVFWCISGKENIGNATLNGITDWRGSCQLDFAKKGPQKMDPDFANAVFVITVDFHGLRSITVVDNPGRPFDLDATVLGNRLFLRFPEAGPPQGSIHRLEELKLVTFPYVYSFYDRLTSNKTINKGAKKFVEYGLREMDPYCNAALFLAKKTGNYWVAIASRPRPCVYQTQDALPPHASTVSRMAEINGFDYLVKFTLWRMSD